MEQNELEKVLGRELKLLGFDCVKLELAGSTRNPIVRLYIDREGGVSIKDCSLASRTVSMVLDELDPFPGRYLLEVSSPGSNRPLARAEHYQQFAGCQARIECRTEDEGKKTYTGNIRSCINEVIALDTDQGQQLIRLADVIKANLVGREYKIDKKQRHLKKKKGDER